MSYKTTAAAGAKKAIKDPLEKGAIKMRMVGALVLKWSQKVNGMTHKRDPVGQQIDLFVQEIFISFNTPSSYHSNAKSPVILFKSRLAIFTIAIKDTHGVLPTTTIKGV